MSNKKSIIELPSQSNIKNIQTVYEKIMESLNGKKQILIKGHLSSCDLTLAQLVIQARKEYSERIDFEVSADTEIEELFIKAGIKF